MFSAICSGDADVKTALIGFLARKPRLSARELHRWMVKDYAYDVTYQYVHKALSQMVRQDVLDKAGSQYVVSGVWLDKASGFLDEVGSAKEHGWPVSVLELPAFGSVEIASRGPLCTPHGWVLKQAAKIRKAKGSLNSVVLQRRAWPLLVLDSPMMDLFSSVFKDSDQYALVMEGGRMDRYFSGLWRENGFKTKVGVEGVQPHADVVACGDFVFQLVHSRSTKKTWDAFYDVLSEEDSKGLWLAYKLACKTPTACRMVVTRNGEFADQLRLKARSLYEARVETA